MITKGKLRQVLIEAGWHIGDGVDDCTGWDDEEMEDSLDTILKLLED